MLSAASYRSSVWRKSEAKISAAAKCRKKSSVMWRRRKAWAKAARSYRSVTSSRHLRRRRSGGGVSNGNRWHAVAYGIEAARHVLVYCPAQPTSLSISWRAHSYCHYLYVILPVDQLTVYRVLSQRRNGGVPPCLPSLFGVFLLPLSKLASIIEARQAAASWRNARIAMPVAFLRKRISSFARSGVAAWRSMTSK